MLSCKLKAQSKVLQRSLHLGSHASIVAPAVPTHNKLCSGFTTEQFIELLFVVKGCRNCPLSKLRRNIFCKHIDTFSN